MAKKEQPIEDPNQELLPGTGPSLEQFIEDVKAYETAKTARMDMLKIETDAKKTRDAGAKYHRSVFEQDPDNDDTLIFKQGGVRVEIKKKATEEIKSKLDDSPDDEAEE
jgi:hypothetical protein